MHEHTAPSGALVIHPATLSRRLDAAEQAIYQDAEAARSEALDVLDASAQLPRGSRIRIRAEVVLVILDAQAGRTQEAIHRSLHLADEAERDGHADLAARLFNIIGASYDAMGMPERALGAYSRCVGFARAAEARDIEAKVETNLGVAWSRMGEDLKALRHLRRALIIGEELGRGDQLGRVHLDIVESHLRLGDVAGADEHLAQARACIRRSGHTRSLPHLFIQEGMLQAREGQHAAATRSLSRAAEIASRQEQLPVEVEARTRLAQVLRSRPNPDMDRAVEEAAEALRLAVNLDSDEECISARVELSAALEARGDLAEALRHERAGSLRREEAWRRRVSADVAALRVTHEVEALRAQRAALEDANRRLQELSREREEFVSIATHDLRAPLTLVRDLADDLQRPGGGRLKPEHAGAVLARTARRMTSIIDRVIASAELERPRPAPKTGPRSFDVGDVVREALRALALPAGAKGLHVDDALPEALVAVGDPEAVALAVVNLLDNAIKFSHPNGTIRVEGERRGEQVEVRVLDRGPGLTDEDLERAFHKFSRLSARPTGGEPSHGLGLYVVRHSLEAFGGAVRAARRDGGGACFSVVLDAPAAGDGAPMR